MKTTLLSFFLILLGLATAYGQEPTKIAGIVKDAAGKGLPAASIYILKSTDSSLIKTDITEDNGRFEITVPEGGKYLIRYYYASYQTKYEGPFTVAPGSTFTAPDAVLQKDNTKLKEVTISSKKPLIEVKADKVVFNVESSINATGSDGFELLRKSPGITVDNNDNISMKGKTGVKIYVDGKMTQLDAKELAAYLKNINSNDIEAIEMISNPSAKYDASGNAGVINIRLKKNKKIGTNGSVNLNVIQGITPKVNGSANLNYRDKKINVFGNIGGATGKHDGHLNLDRLQNDTNYIQRTFHRNDERSINIKAGIDYFINSKSTIGALVTTNVSDNTDTKNSTTLISDRQNNFVKKLTAYNTIPGSRTNNNANLNYKYADTNGHELNADADYGLFRGRGSSLQPNYYNDKNNNLLYSVINQNYTPTDIDIYTLKADWEQRLGKAKLGLGGKVAYVTTKNTFDFYDVVNDQPVKDLSRSNQFKYTENVNAAYANYSRELSTKVSIQAGVRVENTQSKGELSRANNTTQADDTVTRSYTDLFPSAAVTWTINKKNTLNLTYSRRIDRPTYQDLNPFEVKMDELTYQKGNAFLRPQYTQTVELAHTFMGFLNTAAGYSFVNDYSTEVTDTVKNGGFIQQKNVGTQQMFSFNIGSPLQIKKWWQGYVYLWYNYQILEGIVGKTHLQVGIPSYGAYMQQSFTLGKTYSAELSGFINGPSVWGATWVTKPMGGLDIGFQKQLWDKKATLKLTFTDVFFTNPWRSHVDFGGMVVTGSGNWESRTARISFTYRFGSNQISSARERKTGMESEEGRIKGK